MANATLTTYPGIVVGWCDPDGALVNHTVRLDGVVLENAFVAETRDGCYSAGSSTWTSAVTTNGPHTLELQATDAAGHETTASISFTVAVSALSDFKPLVTPKGSVTLVHPNVVEYGLPYYISNPGPHTVTYALTADCGVLLNCTSHEDSVTLAPGAADTVVVSFDGERTWDISYNVTLTATYTSAGGQSVSDVGTRIVRTPLGIPDVTLPDVSPSAATFVAEPGVVNTVDFVMTNVGPNDGSFILTALCDGWAASTCSTSTGQLDPRYNSFASLSFTPLSTLGQAGDAPINVRLIASYYGSRDYALAADTAVVQVKVGYYKPVIAPKTTTVTDPAGTTRVATFSVANSGNGAASYTSAAVCPSSLNCSLWAGSFSLAPGASHSVHLQYTAPPIGETASAQLIVTHQGATAALTEADTATYTTTGANVLRPSITFGDYPGQGVTIYFGSQNITVTACDGDSPVATPTATLNGETVTTTFTPSGSTCKTGTYAVIARPGPNTFIVSASDEVHTTTALRHFTYDERAEAIPVVTPQVTSRLLRGGQQWVDTFFVRNPGPVTIPYILWSYCTASLENCTPSQPTISVPAGQTVKAWISYTTATTGASGQLALLPAYQATSGQWAEGNYVTTNITIDQSAPTATITGPAPNSTIDVFPTIAVQWCDADGSLATRTVKLDGVPLTDAFTSETRSDCTTAGSSTWSSLPVSLGAHTITATVTDAAGNESTSSHTFTFALPPVADFEPAVTPRTPSVFLIPQEQSHTWAIRNAGTRSAVYHLVPDCSAIGVTCQVDRETVTLAPGATDSVHVNFGLAQLPAGPATLRLIATYEDLVGRAIADTGSVAANVPTMAQLYQPLVSLPTPRIWWIPASDDNANYVGFFTFPVKNTGLARVTYTIDIQMTAGFGFKPWILPELSVTLNPGEERLMAVQPIAPIAIGVAGTITYTASYTAGGQTVSSTAQGFLTTTAPVYALEVAPRDGLVYANPAVPTQDVEFHVMSRGTSSVSVDIEATCSGLATNCRRVTLDGESPASFPFRVGGPPGYEVVIRFDVLADTTIKAGSIRLSARGQGAHTNIYDEGTYAVVRAQQPGVVVTPHQIQRTIEPDSRFAQNFVITNTGLDTATFDYHVTCTRIVIECTPLVGQTAALQHNQSHTVPVGIRTGLTLDDTGSVTLRATNTAASAVTAAGTVAVKTANEPLIRVYAESVNPGTTVARDQCLTISAGDAAAYECGDLRIVHPLPTTTTMNKGRTPALVYNSGQARAHGIIAADISVKPGVFPDSLVLTLKIQDVANEEKTAPIRRIKWDDSLSNGLPHRVAVQFDASQMTLTTAAQPAAVLRYTFEARAASGTLVDTDTGEVIVVDRSWSSFGMGWWLDGLERIVSTGQNNADWLWVGGDGSARVYKNRASGVWTAEPAADRPDTLLAVAGGRYQRRLPNRAYVEFDQWGKHVATVNRQGQSTTFAYNTAGLSTITLPVPPGASAPVYRFHYDSVSGAPRLRTIEAPPVAAGLTRDVTLDYQPSTRALRKVSGPVVGDSVSFGLHPSVAGLVTSRTNRRRDGTSYSYEAGLLTQVSIDMSRTADPAITTSFCPAEATTLIACAAKPIGAALVRTRYDGPRNDIADTAGFFLTEFGAPRRIVDALGRQTTLSRGLPAWPFLVTRVDRPGGGVDSTEYRSDRALVSRTLTSASAGRTAVTHVVWHDTLALVKTITSPEGEVTAFTYDAAGNRKTEKRGTASPRWTVYDYDAQNRVIAAFDSGAAPGNASRFHYDADLGNLDSTQSPTGIVSRLFRDAIGRVTVAKTPIDAAQTYFTTAETRYDLMDRDTATYTTGPRVVHGSDNIATYTNELTDTLVVRTKYNAEGYPEEVARVVVAPNPNGLNALVTKTSYDAVHRVRETTAPDNAKEQFFYDDGINLKRMYDRRGLFTQMSYDALNRLKTRTLPGATANDNVGALGSLAIAGDVETFDYDAFGYLSHAKNAWADVFRDYNVDGTLRHELQRVASATGSLGLHDYDLEYTYDLQGRRLTNTHPWQSLRHLSGGGATYRYNEHGELDRITTGFNETFSYFYDQRGRLDSLAYPNGIREIHQYDDDGREILSLHRAPSATLGWHTDFRENTDTIQAARLERDAAGRVITATQYDLNVLRNGYTAHGALKWSQRPRPTLQNAPEVETYDVDPLGNLKQSTFSGTGFSGGFHRYDASTGRLLGIDRTNNDPNDFNQTSWYDAGGNKYRFARSAIVPSLNESSNTNLVTDALFAYDANGRQRVYKERIRNGSDTLVYPAEKFVDQETRYDALGRRVWMNTKHMDKTPSECGDYCYTQRFVWDGNQLLAEFRFPDSLAEMDTMLVYNLVPRSTEVLDPPPPWKQYSWLYGQTMYQHGLGIDAPLAVYRGGLGRDSVDLSGMTMYPHHDWRGNATAVSFATATPTFGGGSGYYTPPLLTDLNKDLTAYGARTNGGRQVTSWVGSLLIGQRDASGLQYRRNRYYDPQSGRFTQEDPIGLAGGMNLYGFANGDPVNFSDPFGLCPDLCVAEGAVAAGAGVYIAGVAVAATIGAILAGDRIGDAFSAGADAARAKVGSIGAWARNKQQASHIKGKLANIEAHFDKLAGTGGPDDGDPNDPRNRDKWKSDIRRAVSQIREHIDKITGDRNKTQFQEAVKEVEKRLGGTP